MTCSGCSSAISRVLTKTPGLQSFNVDLDAQTVDVIPLAGGKEEEGGAGFEEIKEKIRKTGKEILEAEVV
jgi:copper chaperone